MCARKFVFAAALAVVGLLAAPPTGRAAFLLQLTSGAQSTTIDLGALSTGGPGSGSGYTYTFFFKENVGGTVTGVFTNLQFGGYTISAATNITNTPGSPLGGNLSLNGLTVSRDAGSASANNLTIALTATGYTQPSPQSSLNSNFGARLNTLAQTTPVVDFRSSYAVGDSPFGDGVSNLATTAGSNFGAGDSNIPFSASAQKGLNGSTAAYSLTDVVSITGLGFGVSERLDQGGVSTLVTPLSVPAPAGLILMAGAVPFLALLRRRRARPADTTAEAPVAA